MWTFLVILLLILLLAKLDDRTKGRGRIARMSTARLSGERMIANDMDYAGIIDVDSTLVATKKRNHLHLTMMLRLKSRKLRGPRRTLNKSINNIVSDPKRNNLLLDSETMLFDQSILC
jgi:hypothetical protein